MNKTWNHDGANQIIPQGASALATNRALLRALVASFKLHAFTVVRSCDSVSAGAVADLVDRWDADTDLVFDAGAHSWMLLQGAGFQLLLDLNIASATGINVAMSVSAGSLFTGGSTTAAPTATDAFSVRVTGTTLLETTNGAYVLHVVTAPGSTSSPTIVSIWRDGVTVALAFIGAFEGAEDGVAFVMGGWAISATSTDSNEWDYTASLGPTPQFRVRSTTVATTGAGYLTAETWPGFSVANDLTSRYDASPIGVLSDTANLRGRRGWIPDVYFVRVSAPAVTGDIIIAENGDRFALLGKSGSSYFAIPWDASTFRIDDNVAPSTAERAMRPIRQAWAGGGLVLTQETEPLAVTAAAARWTPISASFDVPAGFGATVIVQLGTDSGLWLVAYSDAIAGFPGGFSPLFVDKSTVERTGTVDGGWRYTISVLPVGGWHRPDGMIAHLITREAA